MTSISLDRAATATDLSSPIRKPTDAHAGPIDGNAGAIDNSALAAATALRVRVDNEAHGFSLLWRGAVTLATKIPWLGDTVAVRGAADAIHRSDADRTQHFKDFVSALQTQYGDTLGKAAIGITRLHPYDFLSTSKMRRVQTVAETLQQLVQSQSLESRLEMNVWDYENIFHCGHVSLSVHLGEVEGAPRATQAHALDRYISWWPGEVMQNAKPGSIIGRVAAWVGVDNALAKTPELSVDVNEDGQKQISAATSRALNGQPEPSLGPTSTAPPRRKLKPRAEQALMGGQWGRLAGARIALPFAGNNRLMAQKGSGPSNGTTLIQTPFGLNPNGIDTFWKDVRADETSSFAIISKTRNCSGMAARALGAGGAGALLPMPKALLFLDPSTMKRYALALMKEVAVLNAKATLVERVIGNKVAIHPLTPDDGAPSNASHGTAGDVSALSHDQRLSQAQTAVAALTPKAHEAVRTLRKALDACKTAPTSFEAKMGQMKALVVGMHQHLDGAHSPEIDTLLQEAFSLYDMIRHAAHAEAVPRT